MKCPHCRVALHPAYTSFPPFEYPRVVKGSLVSDRTVWRVMHMRCPECLDVIVYLLKATDFDFNQATETFMVYPKGAARPLPNEVTEPYRSDFEEAARVLADSEKASAALSRRCMQAILRDKAGTKHSTLHNEIQEVVASGKLPRDITDALHALREFGNFAAHPLKDAQTGEVVAVEPGEAEWMLDIIERLFDFYFVGPALTAAKKAALNIKLAAVGKKPLP